MQPVLYDVADHVATLTLNRPDRRNAMDIAGYRELTRAVERASADASVRCLILTGTSPAFCAGDDIRILSDEDDARDETGAPLPLELPARALRRCAKPVIAAVNGAAVGYGVEMLVLSDFRIASEDASFATMYVKRSLAAPADSWERLPALVGPEHAAELLFTGDRIDARRALEIGLVSRVVPAEDLMSTARSLADRLCGVPPLALQASKRAMEIARTGDRKALCDHINAVTPALHETEDFRESLRAFRDRRDPVFVGR